MRALAGLMFGLILTPLGARLALPYLADDLPEFADPAVSLLIWWTDLLAAPFATIELPRFLTGGGGAFPGLGRFEPEIVVALVGWTIIQGVVMTVLALFQRRRPRGSARREDEA